MAALTFAQIEDLWIANGGSPGWAPLAAGIALAESGGNTTALNNDPATGDYSVGLWQINYYGSLLPGRTAEYGSPSALQNDPNAQARAAVELSGNGANWSPWQTDRAWNAWNAAGRPPTPNSTTVQSWLAGQGVPTGGAADASIAGNASNTGAGATANAATAGGGQGGAPYTPSSVPGIPSVAPSFPDFTANPYNELSRVLSWTAEFGGWALFTFIVFIFGLILLLIGVLMLILILAKPVAEPVSEVVGGGIIGRATKGIGGKARSSAPTPAPSRTVSTARMDPTAGAQHAARGRHAQGGQNRVPAREAIRRHNDREMDEDRYWRGQARNADRRNERVFGPQHRGRSTDRAPGRNRPGIGNGPMQRVRAG